MPEYRLAPEVAKLGKDLIKHAHQHLAHVDVMYVFRDQATKSHGRTVLGRARRIGALPAFLADPTEHMATPTPFFLIEIAHDMWAQLSEEQRLALVDHELCHCKVDYNDDGVPVLQLQGHDYEEFAAIIERHGFWLAPDSKIKKAVQTQLVLAVDEVTTYVGAMTVPPNIDPSTGEILVDPEANRDDTKGPGK